LLFVASRIDEHAEVSSGHSRTSAIRLKAQTFQCGCSRSFVSVKDSVSQFEKPEAIANGSGRKLQEYAIGESTTPATSEHSTPDLTNLMEAVVANENLVKALKRVESNKGAAGIDNRDVTVLRLHLKEQWPQIKAELLSGTFKPSPVKRLEIPKPGGGIRKLGIPTVLDRFIQPK
jgi:hypothetical protein